MYFKILLIIETLLVGWIYVCGFYFLIRAAMTGRKGYYKFSFIMLGFATIFLGIIILVNNGISNL